MPDADQLAIVTLLDARGTALTHAWTGRDEDYGINFPLCADRATAQAYAEDLWRRYCSYPEEQGAALTWTPGPARAEDDCGATRHQVHYLEADGDETNISIYALAVYPDLDSALADTDPHAGVEVVETDWDRLLDDKEN
jgi:hypothetical protein